MGEHRRAAAIIGLALASAGCSSSEENPGGGGAGGAAGTTASMTGGGAGTPGAGGAPVGMSGAGGAGAPTSGSGGSVTPGGSGGASGAGGSGAGGSAGEGTAGAGSGGLATGGAGAGSGGTAGGSGGVPDTVTLSASSFTFETYPVVINGSGVWSGPTSPSADVTSTTFDTVTLENGYLKVTLLPDYGGRILSIVHKPTNRELLYQNPRGTPYLMQEGIFYYDYLVILGGIFPSFPEPEHGKYWNLPYDYAVVHETPEEVRVRMTRLDDLDLAAGVPERYDVGRTDVRVELEVTLAAGSSALRLDTKLTNTRSSAVPSFEYWTVTTLAPGSPPGQTAIPLATRIQARMDQVHLLESSWSWFGQAEERVSGEVFRWNNLSYFENWVDQGTAFANPEYTANWSGLSNYDNDTSVLRVSENTETPGLKLWTFGRGSLDVDIEDPDAWLRPTIEMWHGITPEFWARTSLAANEVRTWTDHYLATFGLREITASSEYGAVELSASTSGSDRVLTAKTTLTLPNQTVQAILRLDGTVVAERELVVAPGGADTISAMVPAGQAPAGAVFAAEFLQGGRSLLTGQTTLE